MIDQLSDRRRLQWKPIVATAMMRGSGGACESRLVMESYNGDKCIELN